MGHWQRTSKRHLINKQNILFIIDYNAIQFDFIGTVAVAEEQEGGGKVGGNSKRHEMAHIYKAREEGGTGFDEEEGYTGKRQGKHDEKASKVRDRTVRRIQNTFSRLTFANKFTMVLLFFVTHFLVSSFLNLSFN